MSEEATTLLRRLLKVGFAFGGLVSISIGAWMVASPENWYTVFPGAIKDFGPFNAHFVSDVGGWYCAGGVLLLFAFTNPMRFGGVALVVSLVSAVVHVGIHIGDIVAGNAGAKHWIIDAPTVFLPLVIYLVMLRIWWTVQSSERGGQTTHYVDDQQRDVTVDR